VTRPRSAAAAKSSTCGRGNAVGLTSILDGEQFLVNKCLLWNSKTHSPEGTLVGYRYRKEIVMLQEAIEVCYP